MIDNIFKCEWHIFFWIKSLQFLCSGEKWQSRTFSPQVAARLNSPAKHLWITVTLERIEVTSSINFEMNII